MPTTLSKEELLKKVCELAAEQVNADASQITEQTSFVADLEYDSLEKVEFMIALEETFDLEIPDEDAQGVETIAEVLDLIGRHLDLERSSKGE